MNQVAADVVEGPDDEWLPFRLGAELDGAIGIASIPGGHSSAAWSGPL